MSKKANILQSARVGYWPDKNNWYYSADLLVNGYEIKLKQHVKDHYPTLDEAVQGLKDAIKKAYFDFNIPEAEFPKPFIEKV